MDPTTEVSLYRAITGRGKSVKGKWIHQGVTDLELAEQGIFCSNQSFAQHESSPGSTGYDLRVPGLPVFLNFDEAIYWLERKKYETVPAIVETLVPLEYLFGDSQMIGLVRNYWDKAIGHVPTRDEIEKHLSKENLIKGECFIQGTGNKSLTEILRSLEIVYRPNQMQDSAVYVAEGFRKQND